MKKENKKETCKVCTKDVLIGKDEYCKLSQYKANGELYKDGYYHVLCYRERFLNNKKLEFDAKLLMDKAFNLMDKIEARA